MPEPHRVSRSTVLLAVIFLCTSVGLLGAAAISTNTFEAGYRFDGLMERIRLALDPPPDRETVPTIEITEAGGDAAVDAPGLVIRLPAEDQPQDTPRPRRKPVDVKLRANPARLFASQDDKDWCAVAGTQIVLAFHGLMDNSVASQKQLARGIDDWETWRDSHNGGWGPAAIAEALADHGIEGYEVRAYGNRQLALRDAAIALSRTRAPVVLIAWRGAHTWIMTGYRAKADPTVFPNTTITGVYVYDPWYPRVSSIWGPSDPPGTFQDAAEMKRNYLRWDRPEGDYELRDGKFLAVVPTIPLKDRPASRD